MIRPTDVVPSVLLYLGLNPDSHAPEDLAKAEELLLKIRPNIRKFHSSEYINALANGDICLALGYSGDIFQARDRAAEAKAGVTVDYSIPSTGAQMWFDVMAIPADAPHVAEAHEFLNYIMKPEVIAKASDVVFYANGNKALPTVRQQGRDGRHRDLSAGGCHEEALHDDALRCKRAARANAHVDQSGHRPVSRKELPGPHPGNFLLWRWGRAPFVQVIRG